MLDFLRENPWCSQQQYQWQLSIAQIRLMSADFSRIEYLDKEKVQQEANTIRIDSAADLSALAALGIPVVSAPTAPPSPHPSAP